MTDKRENDAVFEDAWKPVMQVSDLKIGEMREVAVNGAVTIVIARIGPQTFSAFPAACPHQGAPLIDGQLSGSILECVAHRWRFDLSNGSGVFPRACRLKLVETKIVGDAVYAALANGTG
jgi:nitrite reductase/ring-hydroxylating ferredoxin subunit